MLSRFCIYSRWIHYLFRENTIRTLPFCENTMRTLRGGSTFDPLKNVKEVGHVTHMHADSLLIHHNFPSKLMISWLNLFENLYLIRFQTDQKLAFGPVQTNKSGSKLSFRTVYHSRDNELSHVIINYEEKFGWIKSESSCICFTWLSSFTDFSGSKVGPPRIFLRKYHENNIFFAPIPKSRPNWKQK